MSDPGFRICGIGLIRCLCEPAIRNPRSASCLQHPQPRPINLIMQHALARLRFPSRKLIHARLGEERQIARNRIDVARMRRNNHQRTRTLPEPAPPPRARAKTPRLRRASRHAPLPGWRSRRQSRDANPVVRPTPAAVVRLAADPRQPADPQPSLWRGRSRRGGRFHVPEL